MLSFHCYNQKKGLRDTRFLKMVQPDHYRVCCCEPVGVAGSLLHLQASQVNYLTPYQDVSQLYSSLLEVVASIVLNRYFAGLCYKLVNFVNI